MIKGLITVFSFFTAIPMPFIEWKEERLKFITPLLWVVGLLIGIIGFGLSRLASLMDLSPLYTAIILVAYYAIITGGLHIDGLMDSADAYFSRRDLERRLEIMKDSRVGAFAVLAFALILIMKIGTISEIINSVNLNPLMILIPIYSRVLVSLLICTVKNATDNGMTVIYKQYVKPVFSLINLLILILLGLITWIVSWQFVLVLPVVLIFFSLYIVFVYKAFKGITGDLLGAFLELSELLMWMTYLGVVKIWF